MAVRLLTAANPYLQLLSLCSLTPPPGSFAGDGRGYSWRLRMLIFGCNACVVLALGAYVSYVNVIILDVEIRVLQVEDFTNALGVVQKVFYLLLLSANILCMLILYPRMGRIYAEIGQLETDIETGFVLMGTPRRCKNFRLYLAVRIGLWIIFLFTAVPRFTLNVLTDFMHWRDKVITEVVMVVMQLKSVEYTLFSMIILELVTRLRYKLIQLEQELSSCNQRELLDALCLSLRRNKQLLARIWNLVGELEGYFMLPMLIYFLYNAVCILHIVNWAYIQALNPKDSSRYERMIYAVILLFNLFVTCYVSDSCVGKYNSFSRILHNIRCGSGSYTPQLLRMAVMEYNLQLEHLKLRFTCGGFFDINLKAFGGMLVTIITYTIILIQFKLQDTMIMARQKSNQNLNVNSQSGITN